MSKDSKVQIVVGVALGALLIAFAVLYTKCSSDDAPALEDPFDYQQSE